GKRNGVSLSNSNLPVSFHKIIFKVNESLITPHFNSVVDNIHLSGSIFCVNGSVGKFRSNFEISGLNVDFLFILSREFKNRKQYKKNVYSKWHPVHTLSIKMGSSY